MASATNPTVTKTAAPTAPTLPAAAGGRSQPAGCCRWCGRALPSAGSVGRRRRYCGQACRQRAYENRNALERGALPADAVVLSVEERDDLADRLYQVRCAAEDVATALHEGVGHRDLAPLIGELVAAARLAERIR